MRFNKPFNPIAAKTRLRVSGGVSEHGKKTMAPDRAIAQQTQEKFQFYFLALVFTLLAAAVQSSKFSRSTLEDVLEIGGWAGLLTSGLFGLWKLEWDSAIRVQLAKRDEFAAAITQLQQQMHQGLQQVLVLSTGAMQDVNVRMQNYQESVQALDKQIKELEGKDAIKYNVAKYGFVLGLLALMGSRCATGVAELFGYVLL